MNGPPPSEAGPSQPRSFHLQSTAGIKQEEQPDFSPTSGAGTLSVHQDYYGSLNSWDAALKAFFLRVGLIQALRGFELDILVMNSTWERTEVPKALKDLVETISNLDEMNGQNAESILSEYRPLEERKMDYVQSANDVEPQSQTSLNRAISRFLAQNRARNDSSNRAEFLYSPAQKKRRIEQGIAILSDTSTVTEMPSCARTDAKPIDRDIHMKYDIAKNEDGPLRRTLKNSDSLHDEEKNEMSATKPPPALLSEKAGEGLESIRHSGLDERITNIETHLSVRYVPSPPRALLDRLKFLEDHIVRLERDYPPWAALHFNQPKRGWPPPPRAMPIIVPPSRRVAGAASASTDAGHTPSTPTPVIGKWKNNKSSLHRAVLEKLEVQKAMNELGNGES